MKRFFTALPWSVVVVVALLAVVVPSNAQVRPKGAPVPTPTPYPSDCDQRDLAALSIQLLNYVPFPVESPPSCEGPASICASHATVAYLQRALQNETALVDIKLRLYAAASRCQ